MVPHSDWLIFRLDQIEHNQRRDEKEIEVLFDGNLYRNDTDLFTGFFYKNGNYGPPSGFYFGPFIPLGEGIVTNVESDAYNVPEVSWFLIDLLLLFFIGWSFLGCRKGNDCCWRIF